MKTQDAKNTTAIPIMSSEIDHINKLFPGVKITTVMGRGVLSENQFTIYAELTTMQYRLWDQDKERQLRDAQGCLMRFCQAQQEMRNRIS